MTDAERKAMEWLENVTTGAYAGLTFSEYSAERATTLKAMLARPVLPEHSDQGMREIYALGGVCDPVETHRRLYAHLTAPRTKTVWTVHVSHGPNDSGGTLHSEDEAIEQARGFLSLPGATVTISTREVPA